MPYDSFKHHRRSIRLRNYDYSQQGAYFITICTENRACIFGDVLDGVMQLSDTGKIAEANWQQSAEMRQEIELDEWVIMPNHVHGIVLIVAADSSDPVSSPDIGRMPSAPTVRPKPRSLSTFVQGFKGAVTSYIWETTDTRGAPVWQRNYHDRIIRNERELDAIRNYIINNPLNWKSDQENPTNS